MGGEINLKMEHEKFIDLIKVYVKETYNIVGIKKQMMITRIKKIEAPNKKKEEIWKLK